MAKLIGELTPEQAARRREQRAASYARNPDAHRAAVKRYKEKKKMNPLSPPPSKRLAYSPQDYAEEWEWLTEAGMLSSDIIARSTPSRAWFKKHITPLVKYANCPGCGRKYLVAKSRTLLICGRDCPKCNYTEDRHMRTLEVSHG